MERRTSRDSELTEMRTHEPSLRELTAELDGLKSLLLAKISATREVVDERDRLYKERDEARRTAVDAALTAVKDQTKASFEASEKAIVKAEDAQRDYNVRSNEFRGQLDDQAKLLMPRTEAVALLKATEEKVGSVRNELEARIAAINVASERAVDAIQKDVAGLRESRSLSSGRGEGSEKVVAYIFAAVGALIGIGGFVFALLKP